ncbi:MAG: porin family protein [Elusimicrobiota bacterium]|jgi:opacity protein-like surface antigen|nr:porin family protein [Elusimicrobiota bacterium]
MKKLVIAVAAAVFFAGSVFAAGEINVKAGVQLGGSLKVEGGGESTSFTPPEGFSIGAEFLYPVAKIVKVGGGVDYLVARKIDKDASSNASEVSFIPIYAAIQVNPIAAADGVFFKGKVGYSIFSLSNLGSEQTTKGGLTWGLGAGYEFPFGLILGLSYDFYYSAIEDSRDDRDTMDITYSALTVAVGYKFKL